MADGADPVQPATITKGEDSIGEKQRASSSDQDVLRGPNGEEYPTAEELDTLRKVKGKIHWIIYTIAFVELCERFAYYGTTAVFVNFISEPLPPGSKTGAAGTFGQAGALGFSQQASTGLSLFNSFWSYLMPLVGGWLSDSYLGKYKTIHVGIVVAVIGHIIIIVSAIPSVISNPSGALGCFSVGLIFLGIGVGFFKSNISPLIAEQYEASQPRATIRTLDSGERVIVDPVTTISIIYMRYYWFINVGALTGQISMVYAEKYVGFWLAYTLPTIMFLFCPMVLIMFQKQYVRHPPTGSVVSKGFRVFFYALKENSWKMKAGVGFWDKVKPSNIAPEQRPAWMTFDDAWVDEVRRGFKACIVFIYYPLYWLPYNQLYNNLVSQAATLKLNGVPNDIVNNLDPIALLIFIPIFDKVFYPFLRRNGINLTPLKKIAIGFQLGALGMVVAAIIQHYIYMKSPCRPDMGYGHVADCETPPALLVWVQTPAYVLIAFSEIFASITGLEYAFTKAPKNMRGFITGMFWFAQAFSAALSQAFTPMSEDPLLVWMYCTVAIIAFLGGVVFWFTFRGLDREEAALNALPDAVFVGSKNADAVDVAAVEAQQAQQKKIQQAQGLAVAGSSDEHQSSSQPEKV